MKEKSFLSKLKNYFCEGASSTAQRTKQALTISEGDFIKALQADIEQLEEHFYAVKIQGGEFYLNFNNNIINIIYHDFYFCSNEDYLTACIVADELNNRNSVWTISTREVQDDENPIAVSIAQTIHLNNDLEHTIEYVRLIIDYAFQVARDFRSRFNEVSQSKSSIQNNLVEKDYMNRLQHTKQLVDISTWKKDNQPDCFEADSPFSGQAFREFFKDTQLGNLLQIRVVNGSSIQEMIDPKQVQDFNIRDYIRTQFKTYPPDALTFILSFEKDDFTISLKKLDGSNDRSIFYSFSAIRTGADIDIYAPQDCVTFIRSKIEIRLTTDREDYWEGKYKIDEALEKLRLHETSEFTAEQIELLQQASSDIEEDVYWGMRYYNMDMYYQSLFHFRRVYHTVMRTGGYQIYAEDFVKRIAFYLGVAYYYLSMFDRAIYYLDQARSLHLILAHQYYICCLRLLKDPSVTQTIRGELHIITTNIGDEEYAERFYPYYLFLKRSLAVELIDENELDDAMSLLNGMIEHEECVEFAKEKLEQVYALKQEEDEHKSEQTIDSYQWPVQNKK